MASFPSTFPLPAEEIRREKLRAMLRSPLIWIPMVLMLGVGIWQKWDWVVILLVEVAVFFLMAFLWFARSEGANDKIAGRVVKRSNARQNEALVARIEVLKNSGHGHYAVTLSKYLELKKQIEAQLEEGGEMSDQRRDIEKLVDGLCLGVAEQFEAVIEVEKALMDSSEHSAKLEEDRKAMLAQIIEGYKTLRKTDNDLSFLLEPTRRQVGAGSGIDLDAIIGALRSESAIADRTRLRIRQDLLAVQNR